MPWSSTEITSGRLSLRPFVAGDADDAFGCITPALTRYMSFEPAPTKAAFEEVWRGWLPQIDAGIDFAFTIRDRETEGFLGLAGLHRAREAEPELGIWIRENAHGHGYGREAVTALAAWAASTFRCGTFSYPVAEANLASRRIAEALGGTAVATKVLPKYTQVIYRVPAGG